MFTESSDLYDPIYDAVGKDYAREAGVVRDLIAHRRPETTTLLDVACGSGRHLEHLSSTLACTGTDLDPGLLTLARARCPGVPFVVADMVDLDLGQQFDVVTCLFSSIGYVGTEDRLGRAIASLARHAVPGGLVIVEPWFQPEDWRTGHVSAVNVDRPELKVTRMCSAERRGDVAVMRFQYLVGTPAGVEHRTELHELTLFTWEQYRRAFEAAGLALDIEPEGLTGRGLLIGSRPGPDR